jgi:hypothetical protein
MEFSFRILDENLVDTRLPTTHETCFIKLPEFVSVSPKPLTGCVVIFVLKTNGNPIVGEAPQRLGEAIVEFSFPLACQEYSNLVPALKELIPISPLRVLGVSEGYSLRITAVPRIFSGPDFSGCSF